VRSLGYNPKQQRHETEEKEPHFTFKTPYGTLYVSPSREDSRDWNVKLGESKLGEIRIQKEYIEELGKSQMVIQGLKKITEKMTSPTMRIG
jgi:hypothetical protein